MRLATRSGRKLCLTAGASLATGLAAVAALTIPLAGPAAAGTVKTTTTIPSTAKSIPVQFLGNGHGHGMSQYGAWGAAMKGLSYTKIISFYYPNTTLATVGWSPIRVLISNTGTTLQVKAEYGLTVTKVGSLPYTGIGWYRLIADSGNTETLQAYRTATRTWSTVATKLPEASSFTRGWAHQTYLRLPDGTATRYYGYLRAIRRSVTGTAGGVGVVNLVTLDAYTQGVAPREMPAWWSPAALAAQAVAARTYGRYAVEHPMDTDYDICDTSACQVYGGAARFNANGSLAWTDDPAAIAGNSNQVLRYDGTTIFAQFSASNGGWTAAGGQPYLVAKPDPYDPAGSNDPYDPAQTTQAPLASLAAQFGLKSLASITLMRDGNGTWGGRVLSGAATGKTSTGATKTVSFTGYGLQNAVNNVVSPYVGTTWIAFGKPA
jgi:SpoIID/LytB domain protein